MGHKFKQWASEARLSILRTFPLHSLQASVSASSIPNGLALGCFVPGMQPVQMLVEIGAAERELARPRFRVRAGAAQAQRKAPTSQRCVAPESSM